MANVGTADAGRTLIADGQGKSPTFAAIGTKSGLAAHGVLIGAGASAFTVVGPTSTAGQVFQSAGASVDPAFSTATYPAIATSTGTLMRADGTNWVHSTSTYPDTNAINTLLYASGTNAMAALATANNGTLVTSATGVPSILGAPATTGQIFQSNAAAPPSFSTASYPSSTTINQILYSSADNAVAGLSTVIEGVLITSHTGVPSILPNGTPGQVFTANLNLPGSWQDLPPTFQWQNITSGQTMAVNNGYSVTSGALSLALPTTSAVGTMLEVVLAGGTSWTITQASGQQIFMGANGSGAVSTTSGATGTLVSVRAGDWVKLVCITANTVWQACVLQGDAITYT